MKNIVIIDNYDSFTFNLVHYVEAITNLKVKVLRNDEFNIDDIEQFTHIILSPGPGLPKDAGNMNTLIKRYAGSKSILGVCLGMQAIGECFGAQLENLKEVYHGIATPVSQTTNKEELYTNISNDFTIGRYHSWVINKATLPDCLLITALSDDGNVMSIRHKELNIRGVQFHPESILTPDGKKMIENYIKYC